MLGGVGQTFFPKSDSKYMAIVMAKGKDLKVIKSFIDANGRQQKGDINNYLTGNNQAGAGYTDSISERTEEIGKTKEIQKICLACSSPAKENLDYCGSCWILVNKPKEQIKK